MHESDAPAALRNHQACQSGIFPENTASLALHRRAGFRSVGVRERIGRHHAHGGRWRDVVFIERRSPACT